MHPENVTDIRKFEQKLRESGMNETARAEAEKVLNRMKQEGQESHEYGMLYDYLDLCHQPVLEKGGGGGYPPGGGPAGPGRGALRLKEDEGAVLISSRLR